ncbi:GNAT family N-acetyltransferase [Neomoorella humiferrea]|uniref:GNAT family N-acetyltransferase n=1 Tax=Neomoorella humiferrea TaxID=676965 RepID=UPI000D03EB9A|nr:GNAT family N-acetyltransferase [Moorella humiferrea]
MGSSVPANANFAYKNLAQLHFVTSREELNIFKDTFKKLVAKVLGLYTEQDLFTKTYEASFKCRLEERAKYTKEVAVLFKEATEKLLKNSFSWFHFYGIFPFTDKQGTLYLAIVKIGHPNTPSYFDDCEVEVINPLFPSQRVGQLYFEIAGETVHIIDLVVTKQGVGIGSFLLNLMEQIVSNFGVKKITGWLSPADIENRDIQIHFYKKNGYSCKFSDSMRQSGSIKKLL